MSSTATITVSFGSQTAAATAANAHLSAELDPRPTGLNNGITQFNPGGTAWFLVYTSSNVGIPSDPVSSAGTIGGRQAVTGITKTQQITFAGVDTATIQVPATSIVSHTWLGRDLGTPVLEGNMTGVKVPTIGVGVMEITYLCDATAFSVTAPTSLAGLTSFSIAILVTGALIA
jgi:hypothetical protein